MKEVREAVLVLVFLVVYMLFTCLFVHASWDRLPWGNGLGMRMGLGIGTVNNEVVLMTTGDRVLNADGGGIILVE